MIKISKTKHKKQNIIRNHILDIMLMHHDDYTHRNKLSYQKIYLSFQT